MVILFSPEMFMVNGPPAFIAGKTTIHLLSAPVWYVSFFPLKRTVIFSPGEAHPQILIFPVSLQHHMVAHQLRQPDCCICCEIRSRKMQKKRTGNLNRHGYTSEKLKFYYIVYFFSLQQS